VSEVKEFSEEEIKIIVRGIDNLRTKALACVLYLTGARVSEVVKELRKEDVSFGEVINGKSYTVFRGVLILKRRDVQILRRNIPINEEHDAFFIRIVKAYVEIMRGNVLFNFSRQRAHQLLYDKYDVNPHCFRHARLTHLAGSHRFSGFKLRQFTGWKKADSANPYVHLNMEDLLD